MLWVCGSVGCETLVCLRPVGRIYGHKSLDMEPSTASPPPAKRRKLSNDMTGVQPVSTDLSQTQQPPSMTSAAETEREKELRSGITAFVHPDLPGFSGVLKQRQASRHPPILGLR